MALAPHPNRPDILGLMGDDGLSMVDTFPIASDEDDVTGGGTTAFSAVADCPPSQSATVHFTSERNGQRIQGLTITATHLNGTKTIVTFPSAGGISGGGGTGLQYKFNFRIPVRRVKAECSIMNTYTSGAVYTNMVIWVHRMERQT